MQLRQSRQDLNKAPVVIAKMFDRIAMSYDWVNIIISFGIHLKWRRKAIQALEIKEGDLILDVATGTGDMAYIALSESLCSVVGVDLSSQMIKRASQKKKPGTRSRYTLVRADALCMPYAQASFDHAITGYGMRNVEDMQILFHEIARVLKPGGRFCALEFSQPSGPVIKCFFMVYLKYVLPLIGGMLSGDYAAFRYLRDSVLSFPAVLQVEKLLETSGLHVIISKKILFGTSHLYIAQK